MKKYAFITGANKGIGYELVRQLAEKDYHVFLGARNEQLGQQAVESLNVSNVSYIQVDISNSQSIQEATKKIHETTDHLHLLINNAGMQHVSPIEDFPTEKFELLIKIMQIAPFIAIKHAFPIMKKQKYGRIINVASINGLVGFAGKAAYNSAKHGVIGLTKVAALEGATHGITVNALCPGYVDTPLVRNQLQDLATTRNVPLENVLEDVIYPLVPQKRLLQVQEIADYAMFLASEKAKGITGQAVVIDGGYTAQ